MEKLQLYINIGILFSIILGTLLHFTYDLSEKNKLVGYFSATNESVWEHTKLTIFPAILTTLIIYIKLYPNASNLFPALATAVLLPIIIIPSLFYLYIKFTKHPVFPLDITIYLISVIITLKTIQQLLQKPQVSLNQNILSLIIFIFTINAILKYTYNPPNLSLFKEFKHKLYINRS
ncbi:MAG: DUF6512 family protein [Peptostreptococcaceae bacterium]